MKNLIIRIAVSTAIVCAVSAIVWAGGWELHRGPDTACILVVTMYVVFLYNLFYRDF